MKLIFQIFFYIDASFLAVHRLLRDFSTSWITVVSVFSGFPSDPHSLLSFFVLEVAEGMCLVHGFNVRWMTRLRDHRLTSWGRGVRNWQPNHKTKSQAASQKLALRNLPIMPQSASSHSSAPVSQRVIFWRSLILYTFFHITAVFQMRSSSLVILHKKPPWNKSLEIIRLS